MKISDYEKVLQKMDPRLTIVKNPNREGLANVKLSGRDICPVPAEEIKDTPDPNYTYTFPNGMIARHNSIEDVTHKVNHTLEYIKTEEGKEVFFS
jgi:hypothetical protein